MKRTRTIAILIAGLLVTALAVAGPAAAKDRNKDGLPDRWEKRYDLSLKVKQGKRDQDEDGLNNRGEFAAGTSPRQDDSDDDGSLDGDENAGVISAFDGETLTIDLYGGGSVTGTVDENTEVKCGNACGKDGEESDESGSERSPGPGHEGDENHEGSGPEGGPGRGESRCSADDLAVDAVVREAELRLKNGSAVFDEIELADVPEAVPAE